MRMTLAAVLVVATVSLGLGAVGCSSEEGGRGCHLGMFCTIYSGYGWTVMDIFERCDGMQGELVDECPLEDLLGTCTNDVNDERETVDYFYGPYFTPSVAEYECNNVSGIWEPME